MAKKKNDLNVDDIGRSGDNDGIDDLDLNLGLDDNPLGDSSPVKRLSSKFLEGSLETATDSNEINRRLKLMVPDEYESVVDTASMAASTPRELYNTIAKESVEGVNSVKKLGGKVVEKYRDKMPSGLADRLETLLAVEERQKGPSKEEIEDENIANSLASIFDAKERSEQEREAESQADESVRHAISDQRDIEQSNILGSIYQSVNRQTQYQDNILARYQRQSLKLQYRQLYVSRDSLAVLQKYAQDSKEVLSGILKNTGLPEYRKTSLMEAGSQRFREDVLGNIQNKYTQRASNFLIKLRENATKKLGEKVKGISDSVSQMAGMGQMAVEMDSPGGSTSDMAAGAVGGMGTNRALNKVLKFVGEKYGDDERVRGYLSDAMRMIREAPEQFEERLNDGGLIPAGVPGAGMINDLIKESMPDTQMNNTVTRQGIETSRDATYFDELTRRSIVEIIPGYLSRIHNEIYQLRTGDEDKDSRLEFNIDKGRFDTYGDLKEDVKGSIFKKGREEQSQEKIVDLIDTIDPNGDLSVKARQQLGLHLLEQTEKGTGRVDVERIVKKEGFSDSVDADSRDEIADIFKRNLGYEEEVYTDKDGFEATRGTISNQGKHQRDKISKKFSEVKNELTDVGPQLQAYAQLGQKEILRDIGFLREDEQGNDTINREEMRESRLSGDWQKRLTDDEKSEQIVQARRRALQRRVDEDEEAAYKEEEAKKRQEEYEKTWLGRKSKKARETVDVAKGRIGLGIREQTDKARPYMDEIGRGFVKTAQELREERARNAERQQPDLSPYTAPESLAEITELKKVKTGRGAYTDILKNNAKGIVDRTGEVYRDRKDQSDEETPETPEDTQDEGRISPTIKRRVNRASNWVSGKVTAGRNYLNERKSTADDENVEETPEEDGEGTKPFTKAKENVGSWVGDKVSQGQAAISGFRGTKDEEPVDTLGETLEDVTTTEPKPSILERVTGFANQKYAAGKSFLEDEDRNLKDLLRQKATDVKGDAKKHLDTLTDTVKGDQRYKDLKSQLEKQTQKATNNEKIIEIKERYNVEVKKLAEKIADETEKLHSNGRFGAQKFSEMSFEPTDQGSKTGEELLRVPTPEPTNTLERTYTNTTQYLKEKYDNLGAPFQRTGEASTPTEQPSAASEEKAVNTGRTTPVGDSTILTSVLGEVKHTNTLLDKIRLLVQRSIHGKRIEDTGRGTPDHSGVDDNAVLRDHIVDNLDTTGDPTSDDASAPPPTVTDSEIDAEGVKALIQEVIDQTRENGSNIHQSLEQLREQINQDTQRGVDPGNQRIIDTLERVSDVPEREQQVLLLTRILKTLEANAAAKSKGDDGESGGIVSGVIKGTAGLLGKFGRGSAKGLGRFYGGVFGGLGGLARGAGSVAAGAGRGVGGILSGGSRMGARRNAGRKDVYVKGKSFPVMRATDMKEGIYLDSETGDPIRNPLDLKGLKGDVITMDSEGNPQVVVSQKELSTGVYDVKGKPFDGLGVLSGIGGAINGALSGLGSIYKAYTKPLVWAKDGAMSMGRGIGKMINKPIDVYVKGENEPRLLARLFKNNGYVSGATGEILNHHSDIDGPVLPLTQGDGVVDPVLTLEDMAKGLVDVNGNDIDLSSRIKSKIATAIKMPFKAAKWTYSKYLDALKWGGGVIADGVSGIKGMFKGKESQDENRSIDHALFEEQVTAVKDIRDILKERFGILEERYEEKQEAKEDDGNPFDTDDDGDRDGSWRDQFAERDAEGDEDPRDTEEKTKEKKGGGLLSTLGRFLGPLTGALTSAVMFGVNKLLDGFGSLFGGLKDLLSSMAAAKAAGSLGRPNPGRGNPPAGGDADRNNRNNRNSRGNRTNRPSGGGKGRLARTAAKVGRWGLAAAPFLKTAALWTATAAGAVLTSPVTLTVGAVAVVGGISYYLYNKYKKDSFGEIETLRFNQYGLTENAEFTKALYIEDTLKDHVEIVDGSARLSDSFGFDESEESLEFFENLGLDLNDGEQINRFLDWLGNRMIPIYLTHKAGLHGLSTNYTLSEIDSKLSDFQKANYLTSVRNINFHEHHPYTYHKHPFNMGSVSISAEDIQSRFDALAQKYLDKAEENAEERMTGGGGNRGIGPGQGHRDEQMQERVQTIQTMREDYEETSQDDGSQYDQGLELTLKRDIFTGTSIRIRERPNDTLDALKAIRYKAYGLKSMNADKVGAIQELEEEMFQFVRIDGDGVATLDMNNYDPSANHYSNFGIGTWEAGLQSRWREWFHKRFINVYLAYIGAVGDGGGGFDHAMVDVATNPRKALDVANGMINLKVETEEGEKPVWALSASPFKDYVLNSDPASTEPNLNAIRTYIEEKRLEEETETSAPRDSDQDEDPGVTRARRDQSARERIEANQRRMAGMDDAAIEEVRNNPWSTAYPSGQDSSTGRVDPSSEGGGTGRQDIGSNVEPITNHQRAKITEGEGYSALIQGMAEMGITDPNEQAMVLAQMSHESAGFSQLEENLNYSKDGLIATWPNRFANNPELAARLHRKPNLIANSVYGNRMGNTEPEDGWKYRGRGFIQLTGKDNYTAVSEGLGEDYVNNPDLLSDPLHAAKASLWWWQNRSGLSEAAQQGDVTTATRLINGGTNGLDDRVNKWNQYSQLANDGTIPNQVANAGNNTSPAETAEEEEQVAETGSQQEVEFDQGGNQVAMGETDTGETQTASNTTTSTGGGATTAASSDLGDTSRSTGKLSTEALSSAVAVSDGSVHPDEPYVAASEPETTPRESATPDVAQVDTPSTTISTTTTSAPVSRRLRESAAETESEGGTTNREVNPSSIEAARSVNALANRDSESVNEIRRIERLQSEARQRHSAENDTRVVSSLENVAGLMDRSLDTQISMNSTLAEVLVVLREQKDLTVAGNENRGNDVPSRNRDTSTADLIAKNRQRDPSGNTTPRDLTEGAIPLTKTRYS